MKTKDNYEWTDGTPLYYINQQENRVVKLPRPHVGEFASPGNFMVWNVLEGGKRLAELYLKRSNALRYLFMKRQDDISAIAAQCSWINSEIAVAEREESGR